jgi:hypothetical protein
MVMVMVMKKMFKNESYVPCYALRGGQRSVGWHEVGVCMQGEFWCKDSKSCEFIAETGLPCGCPCSNKSATVILLNTINFRMNVKGRHQKSLHLRFGENHIGQEDWAVSDGNRLKWSKISLMKEGKVEPLLLVWTCISFMGFKLLFIYLFCSTGVWTQGLHHQPFCDVFFQARVLWIFSQSVFEPQSSWSMPPE